MGFPKELFNYHIFVLLTPFNVFRKMPSFFFFPFFINISRDWVDNLFLQTSATITFLWFRPSEWIYAFATDVRERKRREGVSLRNEIRSCFHGQRLRVQKSRFNATRENRKFSFFEFKNPFHKSWRKFAWDFQFLIKNLCSSVPKSFRSFVEWTLLLFINNNFSSLFKVSFQTRQLSTVFKVFTFTRFITAP